jgi:hypothetical protein
MGLNLNAVHDFIFALELIICIEIIVQLLIAPLIVHICRKFRMLEFEISSVQLEVYQLINELANDFSVAWP